MRTLIFLHFFILPIFSFAGKISGKITDQNNQPLSFSSILVKGTLKGTSANVKGEYSIMLDPGTYTLVAQHVGYRSLEKTVTVTNSDQQVDFALPEQQYDLGNVVVKQGEDPAYEIIRNTIKKKPDYENEIKKYQAEVYAKGQLKVRDHPNKFMGQKVDFEDGDTSKKKVLFLSETVAKLSVDGNKQKIEVLSTKVSGNSDAFGFSGPQVFSFYQDNIMLGNLNPRGFISPIAIGALNFYNYKLEGTFFENNQMINRIRVAPKRKYEPLFNGYINIIENEWRVHSVQLILYKENQMQFVDTLRIEQLYVPAGNVWTIKQQTIYPAIKMFGFDMHGYFLQVYDDFNLNPVFAKGFFDNTILKYNDSSNKKPASYWDTARPVPLLEEEVKDYQKKDSLEVARQDPKYLDSLDRKRNQPNVMGLITTGQTFGKEKQLLTVSVDALLDIVNYNTMEGAVINFAPQIVKRFSKTGRKRLAIIPSIRYGFSNQRFNSHLTTAYTFGKKYSSTVSLSGGRRVYQFDNNNPILPRTNTISTLYYERNYLKLYEAAYMRAAYSAGIGEGFTIGANVQFQDRSQMVNTTDYKWRDLEDRFFTPNLPLPRHQALQATFSVTWQPGARYIEMPDRKINIGSRYPTLSFAYTHGIKGLAGSDVDFSRWQFVVNDDINLKLLGRLSYRATAGGFIHSKSAYLPDYQHYLANQYNAASRYLQSFQLMPFYTFSNTQRLSTTAHIEYHLNGLLTNKIPGFKKLNWFLVTGSNLLYLNNGTYYTEAFVGVENILKVFRIDYVRSFTNHASGNNSGIRFSVPVILRGEEH
ncbi:DUF5686 and carboxypeptidase regulatory-like domain-containing protein [Aridibaculum aurantiacum]|uniref:DUF5686 and carboxypeptidase regulatory-like domain-containing protein n=1 Tax=Aridibaculum aurantiacum TaxID=2810307 RepID=UPI001A9757C3|nr:DUF5686 and carboxypeptidase regulatory-like domain-containing protein [Aridibaculum aurantiacum]